MPHGADHTIKRKSTPEQQQGRPATVTDDRGITLSAGVAAFDETLDKEVEDVAKKGAARPEQLEGEGAQ
jgi:hypothetical protein